MIRMFLKIRQVYPAFVAALSTALSLAVVGFAIPRGLDLTDESHMWIAENSTFTPTVPDHCDHSAHLYFLLLPDLKTRTQFIQHIKNGDIMTVYHYLPFENSRNAQTQGWDIKHCPISNDVSQRLIRLPLFTSLMDDSLNKITDKNQPLST